jgi:hypothetical protein
VSWIEAELALVAVAAMLSPTTLSFSTLALVLGERPLRTGFWFYVGALGATLAIGVVAAFVLGDAAASDGATPKTWVAVVDVFAGSAIVLWVFKASGRPPDPGRAQSMVARMGAIGSASAVAIVGAGAALANPGGFIPLALKDISETDPTAGGYAVQWLFFALVSLLPLAVALLLLLVVPAWTARVLAGARRWLERHARTIAFAVLLLLAACLLRNGIVGLLG